MESPFRVAVMPGDSMSTVERCLRRIRPANLASCQHEFDGGETIEAVRVMQGEDVRLQAIDGPLDFDLNSTSIRTLLSGSADMILGPFYITHERMSAGIRYSNPIANGKYAMLYRSRRSDADISFNTHILTDQLPTNVLLLNILFFFVTMILYLVSRRRIGITSASGQPISMGHTIWEFIREMLPGSNTNSFPSSDRLSFMCVVKSATILSMFYQLFQTALLAQSLMVRPGVDLETRSFDALNSLTNKETVMFQKRGAHFHEVMRDDHEFSRLILEKSKNGVPTVPEEISTRSLVDRVKSQGDVWMAPYKHLLYTASQFTDAECRVLRITKWPPFVLSWSAIPLGTNISAVKREYLSRLATERSNFDEDYVESLRFSPVCRQYLFPKAISRMKFHPIDLVTISGIFWVWTIALGAALLCFCGEFICRTLIPEQTPAEMHESAVIVQNVDSYEWKFDVVGKQQREWLELELKNIQYQLEKMP